VSVRQKFRIGKYLVSPNLTKGAPDLSTSP
jgi:hypothetical protein